VRGVGRLCIRGLDKAKNPAGSFVDPVPEVFDSEPRLGLDVFLVSLGDVIGRDSAFDLV
jgi:hypothetical protein